MLPTSDIPGLFVESPVPIVARTGEIPQSRKLRARFYIDGKEIKPDEDGDDTDD